MLVAVAPAASSQATRTLHCSGCGRRLLDYSSLGTEATIRVRCRDCKGFTELHGADVTKLLTTLSKEG